MLVASGMENSKGCVRSEDSWAEIRAHGRVIRYQCRGSGRPILLLAPAADTRTTGCDCRVIAPELPEPGSELTAWLTAFLDGLGASGVTILAAEPFYPAALELASDDGERVIEVIRVPG